MVVAFGGGSVIDAGKAVAALLTNTAPLLDYLEVVGRGQPLTERSAPLIAIPTTAGTGAEVTRNAVLMVEAEQVKVSLRSPLMLPAVALVDPELTYTLPPDVTASTGSRRADAVHRAVRRAAGEPAHRWRGARGDAARRRRAPASVPRRRRRRGTHATWPSASLCGGLALANAKLGAVHGFAAPLGGMFPIPHGVACARLLPHVVRVNVRALRARGSASDALERYEEVARVLTGRRGREGGRRGGVAARAGRGAGDPAALHVRRSRGGHSSRGRGRRSAPAACRATRSCSPTRSCRKCSRSRCEALDHNPGRSPSLSPRLRCTNASAARTPSSRPRHCAMISWCSRQMARPS